MALIDSKTKSQTQALWKLINDRDIKSEISDEFKALASAGVDVSLQNAANNNNTALHLAVHKNDKKCTKYLLTLKPDLEKQNNNHETPEDLARKLMYENILKLLQCTDSSAKRKHREEEQCSRSTETKKVKVGEQRVSYSINPEFVQSWSAEKVPIESFKLEERTKVLRVFNVSNGGQQLQSKAFQNMIVNSSVFVIIFEDCLDEKTIMDAFNSSKLVIIQFTCTGGRTRMRILKS
jgi:hypothetical protein